MSSFTCLNCSVSFATAEIQRLHYKADWHRYNLKRRVAELPPVTAEEFQSRVLNIRKVEAEAAQHIILFCNPCHKQFNNEKAHANHLQGKKHKQNLSRFEEATAAAGGSNKELTSKKLVPLQANQQSEHQNAAIEADDDIDDVNSDEWVELAENPICENNCIFCQHHSDDQIELLKHMSISHSFFIPDLDYCIDLDGLLFYLAEKVSTYFICLWCNERGRTFYSLDAVRKHMIDKGHCKMLHEGLALAEYAEFYDYSSSYPDHDESMDIDEEIQPQQLDGDEYQLVLPSGAVIGHRSLMRYYKQRLNPNRQLVLTKKSDRNLHKVLAEYRSLGWTVTQQAAAARKARDIHVMQRTHNKWAMKLGVKANKLQKHYREQVNF